MENWTGTMQINRVDGEPLLKSGEWQYDPWWNCWYLKRKNTNPKNRCALYAAV